MPRKWKMPVLAPGASAAVAFEAAVRASIEHVHWHRPGALARRDPECLHQVRVGLRRLRVALRSFRGLARRGRADRFDERIARSLRRLGPARDWDVLQARVALNARAKSLHEAAWRRAEAELGSAGILRLLDEVLAWAQSQPWRARGRPGEPVREFGQAVLRRLACGLEHAARKADWTRERDRHRLRIRAKRLRYAEDFLGEPGGSDLASTLRPLQEALGDLRDLSVQRKLLAEAGMRAPREGKVRRGLLRRVERAWSRYEAARAAVRA